MLSSGVREARKKFKTRSTIQNLERLKTSKALFNEALATAKTMHLETQAEELNQINGTGFWRQVKRTFYNKTDKQHILAITNNRGNTIIDDETKPQILYKEIFCGKHLDSTKFDQAWHTHVLNKVSLQDQGSDTDLPMNRSITIDEISAALQKKQKLQR